MTNNYYSIDTNAVTGETTLTPYTPEQIAAVEAELAQVQVPASITRRQCSLMLFSLQMITSAEAIAMTQTGTPPAAIQTYLDTLPEPQRTMATVDFAAVEYLRDNPLLAAMAQINGMTESQLDGFFIEAAKL